MYVRHTAAKQKKHFLVFESDPPDKLRNGFMIFLKNQCLLLSTVHQYMLDTHW